MLAALTLLLLASATHAEESKPPASFKRDVRPILEKRCQPCHFEGGSMHEKLPFDKPGTIHKLGAKLFTRIRDEHERKVIRAFLATRPE